MAEKPPHSPKLKLKSGAPTPPRETAGGDRIPTNEELLRDLWRPDAKAKVARETPTLSRRTRDFLLLAGIGSVTIAAVSYKVMSGSDLMVVVRLALTGIALLCGLLWFIFYGVMSRY